MAFDVSKCSNLDLWDDLVQHSPQGAIFSSSRFIRSLDVDYSLYIVLNDSGVCVAGIPILEDANGKMARCPYPFVPYQGLMFSLALSKMANHKRVTNQFRITEAIIKKLTEDYTNPQLTLNPNFNDIRPFLWHNYGKTDGAKFLVQTRYTAKLDLSNFNFNSYLMTVRSVRRQEFKKNTAKIYETNEIDIFLTLYREMFFRQGITVDESAIELIKKICLSALDGGYGRLCKAQVDGEIHAMTFFLFDKNSAYYLFAANNPVHRNSGSATALMFDNIKWAAEKGLEKLDFVGANSPNRGDFKISFNAILSPYYEIKLSNYKE